jgi:hypothetical protein
MINEFDWIFFVGLQDSWSIYSQWSFGGMDTYFARRPSTCIICVVH